MPEIILPELTDTESDQPDQWARQFTGEFDKTITEYREDRREKVMSIARELDIPPTAKHIRMKLSARHMMMLNFVLAGETQVDIAKRFNMNPMGICHIVNSPLFQQALRERQREIAAGIDADVFSTVSEAKRLMEEEAFAAAEKLVQLSKSSEQKIALAATNSLLDRCFGTQPKATEAGPALALSGAQIEKLQIVINESRRSA